MMRPSDGWFADVLLERPPREVRAAALALVDKGLSTRDIYLDVLAPALVEVGLRWQLGRASVAQEHLATALVTSVMAILAPRLGASESRGLHAVLACTDGELHAVGLRMVSDFLEADGWEVSHLGAVTPGEVLARFVRDRRPDVVGISTTLTTHLDAARDTISMLQDLPGRPFILVGGRAHGGDAGVALNLGADAFGFDAESAVRLLRTRFLDD